MSLEEDQARYDRAAHAMQSGVNWELNEGAQHGSPKHLRVGVNSAQVGIAALASLLIEKGVFTMEEYVKAQADEMEAEAKRLEDQINERFAGPGRVHLA